MLLEKDPGKPSRARGWQPALFYKLRWRQGRRQCVRYLGQDPVRAEQPDVHLGVFIADGRVREKSERLVGSDALLDGGQLVGIGDRPQPVAAPVARGGLDQPAVPTPAIDALIQIVKSMSGKTFAAEARTLDRMGLSGKDAAGIRNALERGFA